MLAALLAHASGAGNKVSSTGAVGSGVKGCGLRVICWPPAKMRRRRVLPHASAGSDVCLGAGCR